MPDQWCEQKGWLDWGVNTNGIEVFAASTGIVMCAIPFLYPHYKMNVLLYVLQANIVLLGIGTFVFHWWPPEEFGNSLIVPFDWYPMIFTLATLMFIANSVFFVNYSINVKYGSNFVIMIWMFCLMYFLFTLDINIVQALLVVPPVLVLVAISFYVDLYDQWIVLFTALGVWLVNRYACGYWSVLGQLHGIWHIFIGYALWDVGKVLTIE